MSTVLFLLSIFSTSINTTTVQPCDTVYRTVEHMAVYPSGATALLKYINNTIGVIITKYQPEEERPTKLRITLTIDDSGKVIDAVFSNATLTQDCIDALKRELLCMPHWQPALLEGKKVCSTYTIPISCLKWQ